LSVRFSLDGTACSNVRLQRTLIFHTAENPFLIISIKPLVLQDWVTLAAYEKIECA
jgi:hypothetical protein